LAFPAALGTRIARGPRTGRGRPFPAGRSTVPRVNSHTLAHSAEGTGASSRARPLPNATSSPCRPRTDPGATLAPCTGVETAGLRVTARCPFCRTGGVRPDGLGAVRPRGHTRQPGCARDRPDHRGQRRRRLSPPLHPGRPVGQAHGDPGLQREPPGVGGPDRGHQGPGVRRPHGGRRLDGHRPAGRPTRIHGLSPCV